VLDIANKKKPILGARSLEDFATAKLLLFEDSGNDLIPSTQWFVWK
jgi:hypothetical protein